MRYRTELLLGFVLLAIWIFGSQAIDALTEALTGDAIEALERRAVDGGYISDNSEIAESVQVSPPSY